MDSMSITAMLVHRTSLGCALAGCRMNARIRRRCQGMQIIEAMVMFKLTLSGDYEVPT
jgi:hypothetical protein